MDSSVVAVISVISSCITSVLVGAIPHISASANMKQQEKIEKRKMYTAHQLDVIERYLIAASNAIHFGDPDGFKSIQAIIFPSVPEKYWQDITELNQAINEKNRDKANALLIDVSKKLSCYLSSLIK